MTLLEKVKDFQAMQAQNQVMEAFEKYYHDDCVVTEMATGEVRKGKDAQRQAIIEWFSGVEELHGGGTKAITANEEQGTSCVETWFDCTFKETGRMKMEEVGVQQWKDGKIIEERFYYNMPGQ